MAVVGLVLLAALVVGTTYWQAWAASGLADRQDNSIQRVAEFSIKRGKIYAADGKTVLADNVKRKVAGQTLYFRKYPQRGLAAHIVGYSTQVRSRAGLEASENDFLTSSNTNLSTVLSTAFDKLKGTTVKGNDLHLTLRTRAQQVALQALGGKCGAAVAIEPRTGRLLVSVSSPTYDPNLIESQYNLASRPKFGCGPLFNRAEQGLYTPGSAFKVITASAALESGKFTIDSTFQDPGYCIEYGQKVSNFADQSGPERFGSVNFTQALQHSINAVFCEIGKALGGQADPGPDEEVRLLLRAAARDAGERAGDQRRLQQAPALLPEGRLAGRPGPACLRTGPGDRRPEGDADPDGHGRRDDCERRPRHAALRRRAGRSAGWVDSDEDEAGPARPRGQREHGRRCDQDDGGRRSGRHGYRGPDPRDPRRRQDGNRRDRHERTSTRPGSSVSRPPTTRRSPSPSSSSARARPAARQRPRSPSRSWKR